MTLGEQQPVDGISGRRFGIDGLKHLCDIDAKQGKTARVEQAWNVEQGNRGVSLPKRIFIAISQRLATL